MIDVKVALVDGSHMSFKDLMTIIQAGATIAAIIVGGVWTYFLFVKKRQKFPHAVISHEILHKAVCEGKTLLHVKTILNNSGDVLLCLESGQVRVYQVLPIPEDIAGLIGHGEDPVSMDKTEVDWPVIGGPRQFSFEKGKCEIEPGEKDYFLSEYIIDSNVELVSVYSYFKNASKRKRDIGWGISTIYEMKPIQEQNREKGGVTK